MTSYTTEQDARIETLASAIAELESMAAAYKATHSVPVRPFTSGAGWDSPVSCEVHRGMVRGLESMREEVALVGV